MGKNDANVYPCLGMEATFCVQFFRGSYGWVTCDNVLTDRTVNPQGRFEIENAIYLHKNDANVYPCLGMEVTFCVQTDLKGQLKCVDVRQGAEPVKLDLESYKKMRVKKETAVGRLGTAPEPKSTKQVADSQSS